MDTPVDSHCPCRGCSVFFVILFLMNTSLACGLLERCALAHHGVYTSANDNTRLRILPPWTYMEKMRDADGPKKPERVHSQKADADTSARWTGRPPGRNIRSVYYYYNKQCHHPQVVDTFTQASDLLQHITSWMMNETLRRNYASCHSVLTGSL